METRQFVMSKNLLYDIIQRQAGTVEKAWLEAVQNSIDANSTIIDFKIQTEMFAIIDDGKGMSRDEIIKYFEVFGDSAKRGREDKLGNFGMGRGQIFAQGIVGWGTNDNIMIVDVKEKGLNYELKKTEKGKELKGTTIVVRTYHKIPYLDSKIEKFSEWVKYVSIPIIVNGVLVSQKKLENKKSTSDADISISTTDEYMSVYNQGLFVKREYRGVGVTIISRRKLMVNFARNDIMDECPVFKRIMQDVDELIVQELEKPSTYLNDGCRREVIRLMKTSDEMRHKFYEKSVIKMANGKYVSLRDIENNGSYSFFDGKDSNVADHFITGGNIVLSRNPNVMGLIKQVFSSGSVIENDYSEMVDKLGTVAAKIINEMNLSGEEAESWRKILQIYEMLGCSRKLRLGRCPVAGAWTDGSSFIVIEERHVKSFSFGNVFTTLVHEMSHDSDTSSTDLHSPEFYEKFYDLIRQKDLVIDKFLKS